MLVPCPGCLDTGQISGGFAAPTQRAGRSITPLRAHGPALYSLRHGTGIMSDFEEFEKQLSENRQGNDEPSVCAPVRSAS